MNDFWTHVAAKAVGASDIVQPRLPARFETPANAAAEKVSAASELAQTPSPAVDRSSRSVISSGESVQPMQLKDAPPAIEGSSLRTIREPRPASPRPLTSESAMTDIVASESGDPETGSERPPSSALPLRSELRRPDEVVPRATDLPPVGERVLQETSTRDEPQSLSSTPSTAPPLPSVKPQLRGERKLSAEAETAKPLETSLATEIRPHIRLAKPQSTQDQPEQIAPVEPIVRVTIGRIEIKPETPPQRPAVQPRPRFQPPLTLDAYLKRREGEST